MHLYLSFFNRFSISNFFVYFYRSGYVSKHWNPVPLCYRSEHSVHMGQLFLVGYYLRSNMAAEQVVVTFVLKDAFDSFEGVQTKIKEIEDRIAI